MKSWYVDLPYRLKLLLTYLSLSVVPILVLGLFAYHASVQQAKADTVRRLEQTLAQTAGAVSYKLMAIAGAADTIVRSQRIQQILSRAERGYPDKREEIDDYRLLVDFLVSMEDYDYVQRARIFIRPEVLYTRENTNIFHVSQLPSPEILNLDRPTSTWSVGRMQHEIYEGRATTLRLTRTIPDLGSSRRHFAVLLVDCRIDILEDAIEELQLDTASAIIAHDGAAIASAQVGDGLTAGEVMDALVSASLDSREGSVRRLQGRPYLVVNAEIPGLPWRLSAVVEVRRVIAAGRQVARFTAALAVLLIAVDVAAAIYFSRVNTKRLDSLLAGLKEVTEGRYEELLTVHGTDEIGELQQQYNQMVMAINELIGRVQAATDRRREAEFKALESQINPHFLYNTLENVKWMAMRRSAPEIVSVVESLSNLFRFNLNRGKEIVTLGEEVASVREYVAIQNLRFGNRITAEVDIPAGLSKARITKMILQPLVENAIYHGIHAKEGRKGCIRITADACEQVLHVGVQDDGAGMDPATLAGILEAESEGYGVKNVHQRLQLYYGADSGLTYASVVGQGTTVIARLPLDPD